jgi:hypothetical protein
MCGTATMTLMFADCNYRYRYRDFEHRITRMMLVQVEYTRGAPTILLQREGKNVETVLFECDKTHFLARHSFIQSQFSKGKAGTP